jgi:nicotinate-nucleotide adenylyltransferase
MSRVGILGGTFNPIHHGHLHIAREVRNRLGLERVLFIPSADPPHKADLPIPSSAHRTAMVRLAVASDPTFECCDVEVNRSGRSYSVETVTQLKEASPQTGFFFIIGIDAFREIDLWRDAERLLSLCSFAVVSRAGYPFASVPTWGPLAKIDRAQLRQIDAGVCAGHIEPMAPGVAVHFLSIPPMNVSASAIRAAIRSESTPIGATLPTAVLSYIIRHDMYLESEKCG